MDTKSHHVYDMIEAGLLSYEDTQRLLDLTDINPFVSSDNPIAIRQKELDDFVQYVRKTDRDSDPQMA